MNEDLTHKRECAQVCNEGMRTYHTQCEGVEVRMWTCTTVHGPMSAPGTDYIGDLGECMGDIYG